MKQNRGGFWKWDIENKILFPFLAITLLATMVYTGILFFNGYTQKLSQEHAAARSVIFSVEEDLNSLYGNLGQDAIIKKYQDYQNPNLFIYDSNGSLIKGIAHLTEAELPGDSILMQSKNNPLGWTLCYSLDMTVFYNDLVEEQKYMILATIALVIIIVQASIFIAHNISDPIRRLSETCTEISKNPEIGRGETLEFASRRDETGQLALSFQSMLESINNHTDEIVRVKLLNESIVQNLPMGVVAFDENKNIICINSKASQLLGAKDYSIQGALLPTVLWELIDTGRLLHDPVRLQNNDGKLRDLDIGVWRLERPDRSQWGILCTIDDVTYKKMMEERISQNEKLAYTGTLAASLAHEIRNPLAGIRASMQVIIKHLEQENDRRLCSHIVGEVDRVNILIEDLLNLSRKREKQKIMLDLGTLFEELLLLYSKVAENSRVDFAVSIPDSVVIYADEGDLKQIMINVINNSIKAMPNGGKLSLEAYQQGGKSVIIVSDEGRGMSQQKINSIMAGESGGGLGLSIVARLLGQNSGAFTIASTAGEGTVITITFKGVKENEI